MEYTQWEPSKETKMGRTDVLILVVMEYTQWANIIFKQNKLENES